MAVADLRDRIPSEYDRARSRALRRVKELRAFYLSLSSYAVVIPGLWIINWLTYKPQSGIWAYWPMLGWGIALLIWGAQLWLSVNGAWFGADWEERKVQEYLARANLKRVSSEKLVVQAQLRMLQAQIEPHFLFNTLANVQSLIARQPDVAQHMLDNFIAYLRQSLAASRNGEGSLGQEFELLRTYLDLLKIRMGERLTYALDLPAELAAQPLAPMLLQPLVENAVRHGLEPNVAGGRVQVRAFAQSRAGEGRALHIEVEDNGLGFRGASQSAATASDSPTGGVGLSNLRERLAVLYDGKADLELVEANPGTLVRLKLPLQS